MILLFFDPDKPGTTGETLTILTKSLAGMDHKLYIILNKVREPGLVQRQGRRLGERVSPASPSVSCFDDWGMGCAIPGPFQY